MNTPNVVQGRALESTLATNKVIRNTYILLSMTVIFTAITAGLSVFLEMPRGINLVTFIAAIGLLWFVLPRTANTSMGLVTIFAATGLLGLGLGPMLSQYLALNNGPQLVATAAGGTGAIFLGLSGYALTTRKDFSFMGGFLITGLLVVFLAIIANLFISIPALHLAISAVVIMLFSGFILYDTSRIIHGGETNYIMATTGLYLSIFNIFVHLLSLLGIMGGDD